MRTSGVRAADAAAAEADEAAAKSGARISVLASPAEFRRAAGVLQEIWRSSQGEPMSAETLVALDFSGNYVSGAYIDDELVGVSAAFHTEDGGLHSHISGVLPQAQGRRIGFALKMHQRAWALRRDITRIGWTFDPLVRRNAHFNLVALGATASSYLLDFYGEMVDAFNPGDTTDRLFVDWDLTRTVPGDYAESTGAAPVLTVGPDGEPVAAELSGPLLTVSLPEDLQQIGTYAQGASGRWRLALRRTMSHALNDGYVIAGMDATQSYVLRRTNDVGPTTIPEPRRAR